MRSIYYNSRDLLDFRTYFIMIVSDKYGRLGMRFTQAK